MTDEIILTETKPGFWQFIRGRAGSTSEVVSQDQVEQRREAFFASFAPASPKRKYLIERIHWAHLVMGFFTIPIIAVLLSQILS